jgi:hypothetical protein
LTKKKVWKTLEINEGLVRRIWCVIKVIVSFRNLKGCYCGPTNLNFIVGMEVQMFLQEYVMHMRCLDVDIEEISVV